MKPTVKMHIISRFKSTTFSKGAWPRAVYISYPNLEMKYILFLHKNHWSVGILMYLQWSALYINMHFVPRLKSFAIFKK
jgi:hypothetical protein